MPLSPNDLRVEGRLYLWKGLPWLIPIWGVIAVRIPSRVGADLHDSKTAPAGTGVMPMTGPHIMPTDGHPWAVGGHSYRHLIHVLLHTISESLAALPRALVLLRKPRSGWVTTQERDVVTARSSDRRSSTARSADCRSSIRPATSSCSARRRIWESRRSSRKDAPRIDSDSGPAGSGIPDLLRLGRLPLGGRICGSPRTALDL